MSQVSSGLESLLINLVRLFKPVMWVIVFLLWRGGLMNELSLNCTDKLNTM